MNQPKSLKSFVKQHFRGAYDAAGAFKNGLKVAKYRRATEAKIVAVHESAIPVDSSLKKIVTNTGPKRLNLVFRTFSEKSLADKEKTEFLVAGIKFAANKGFDLRIISRNNQANPRNLTTFAKKHSLALPENYSFYTDRASRLSSPVRRLDVTKNDVFFTENELLKLKEWTKQ
ncbi:hypothetical protein IKF94_02035 [Candidatus Saccharibacteria bacterium]|nr:hypothetical protein [Candidatus Saccharibacteria bacterium]